MKTNIQIFNNPQFGEIRTAGTSEQPLFCLADICKALELDNVSQVAQRLDDGVISNYPIVDSMGRTQQANFVNEDGLYDVIFDSKKPEAKTFRKWVTSEVLPSIRKYGIYVTDSKIEELNNRTNILENRILSLEGNGISHELQERNISMRDLQEIAGDDFLDWANHYFTDMRGTCDRLISRNEIYQDFRRYTGINYLKHNYFYKYLKVYCLSNPKIITLNPVSICNEGNRIFYKIGKQTKSTEFFYIQTKQKISMFI